MSEALAKSSKSGIAEKAYVLNFFKHKEAKRTPGYEGYEHIAQNLMRQLEYAAKRARSEDAVVRKRLVELDLQPGADGYYYTESKVKAGTLALISMAYGITGAENNIISHDVVHAASGEAPEDSQIIRRGDFQGESIYFIEQHKHGTVSIKLSAEVPEELLRSDHMKAPAPIYSHAQRMEMWDQYLDSLEGQVPANLTEEDVIKRAIKNRQE